MELIRLKSIKEYHKALGIGNPENPLLSVINLSKVEPHPGEGLLNYVFDFYSISLKRTESGNIKYRYGQQKYDFDNGILFFIAPNQVFSFDADENFSSSGYIILIHPDFLWKTSLVKTIKRYDFFNYRINEALFVSEKEETILTTFIKNIELENNWNIDKFTQNIIVSQIESFLSYSERFYQRQFLFRKIDNHQILERLEDLIDAYFKNENLEQKSLLSVKFLAKSLNISSNYLSGILKTHTGQTTQQHIHNKLIEKAKEKLSTTQLTITEIAYELGFEQSQSFSKLFKSKTKLTPKEFRETFN
ncbi:helix-turn-helix domain-containing protein [Cellulophaga baltica]|uniref:AraC family transcriptional regulator n=1 Tax=Cellulophaga baltica 18 TaxID=1348584 RepID=A0AAU8RP67_9FLAO|nr:AraC family transcriptional regulator [Cellulophaga baltica]AIZ42468.1 AraC family transcriptional regulator [Cellulophaga baltica 18]